MKLERTKLVFGAASVVLLGALIACGGDDDDDATSSSSSGASGNTSSSSGDAATSSSSSSGNGGSTSSGSSSGGANSCTTEFGCWKSVATTTGDDGGFTCQPGVRTTFGRRDPSDAGPSDAGVTLPTGCADDGSDTSQCLTKYKCTNPGSSSSIEVKIVDATHDEQTLSITIGDGSACVTETKSEKVADADCEGDGG